MFETARDFLSGGGLAAALLCAGVAHVLVSVRAARTRDRQLRYPRYWGR